MAERLTRYRGSSFDLLGLCAAAAAVLRKAGTPRDQRVNAVPDARTVRYYQSLGLVDRPLSYAARVAVFGYRHLVQVVATKWMQRQGEPLARIQKALAGRDTTRLESAVIESMQGTAAAPLEPVASAPALVAVSLRDGVVVVIDRNVVADPDTLVRRLRDAL